MPHTMCAHAILQTYPKFVHDKGQQYYGPFVVEVLNYQNYPTMTVHTVKLMKRVSHTNVYSQILCS
jgi:hypothetical protein